MDDVEERAQQARQDRIDKTQKRLQGSQERFPPPELSLGPQADEFFNSATRAFVSTFATIPDMVGIVQGWMGQDVSDADTMMFRMANAMREFADKQYPNDPDVADGFFNQAAPAAIGSMFAFMIPGAAVGKATARFGKILNRFLTGTAVAEFGIAASGSEIYRQALADGKPISEALQEAAWGIPLGATEVVPLGGMIGRLLGPGQRRSLIRAIARGAFEGVEEGLQEAIQKAGVEAVGKDLEFLETWKEIGGTTFSMLDSDEAKAGALAGFLMSLAVSAASRGKITGSAFTAAIEAPEGEAFQAEGRPSLRETLAGERPELSPAARSQDVAPQAEGPGAAIAQALEIAVRSPEFAQTLEQELGQRIDFKAGLRQPQAPEEGVERGPAVEQPISSVSREGLEKTSDEIGEEFLIIEGDVDPNTLSLEARQEIARDSAVQSSYRKLYQTDNWDQWWDAPSGDPQRISLQGDILDSQEYRDYKEAWQLAARRLFGPEASVRLGGERGAVQRTQADRARGIEAQEGTFIPPPEGEEGPGRFEPRVAAQRIVQSLREGNASRAREGAVDFNKDIKSFEELGRRLEQIQGTIDAFPEALQERLGEIAAEEFFQTRRTRQEVRGVPEPRQKRGGVSATPSEVGAERARRRDEERLTGRASEREIDLFGVPSAASQRPARESARRIIDSLKSEKPKALPRKLAKQSLKDFNDLAELYGLDPAKRSEARRDFEKMAGQFGVERPILHDFFVALKDPDARGAFESEFERRGFEKLVGLMRRHFPSADIATDQTVIETDAAPGIGLRDISFGQERETPGSPPETRGEPPATPPPGARPRPPTSPTTPEAPGATTPTQEAREEEQEPQAGGIPPVGQGIPPVGAAEGEAEAGTAQREGEGAEPPPPVAETRTKEQIFQDTVGVKATRGRVLWVPPTEKSQKAVRGRLVKVVNEELVEVFLEKPLPLTAEQKRRRMEPTQRVHVPITSVQLPSNIQGLMEQTRQLKALPPEQRRQAQKDAAEFDRILFDSPAFVGIRQWEEAHTAPSRKKQAQARKKLLVQAREQAAEILGFDEDMNPQDAVVRAQNLVLLREYMELQGTQAELQAAEDEIGARIDQLPEHEASADILQEGDQVRFGDNWFTVRRKGNIVSLEDDNGNVAQSFDAETDTIPLRGEFDEGDSIITIEEQREAAAESAIPGVAAAPAEDAGAGQEGAIPGPVAAAQDTLLPEGEGAGTRQPVRGETSAEQVEQENLLGPLAKAKAEGEAARAQQKLPIDTNEDQGTPPTKQADDDSFNQEIEPIVGDPGNTDLARREKENRQKGFLGLASDRKRPTAARRRFNAMWQNLMNRHRGIGKEAYRALRQMKWEFADIEILARSQSKVFDSWRKSIRRAGGDAAQASHDLADVIYGNSDIASFKATYGLQNSDRTMKSLKEFLRRRDLMSRRIADNLERAGANPLLVEKVRDNLYYVTRFYEKHIVGADHFAPNTNDYVAAVDYVATDLAESIARIAGKATRAASSGLIPDIEMFLETGDLRLLTNLDEDTAATAMSLFRQYNRFKALIQDVAVNGNMVDLVSNADAIQNAAEGIVTYTLEDEAGPPSRAKGGVDIANLSKRYLGPVWRMLYREIQDPAFVSARTTEVQGRMLATYSFMNKIFSMGEGKIWSTLANPERNHMTKLGHENNPNDRKRYGVMAGKYVDPALANVVMGKNFNVMPQAIRKTQSTMRLLKLYGVRTIYRNYQTATLGFAMSNGDLFRPTYLKNFFRAHAVVAKALKNDSAAIKEIRELARRGAFRTSAQAVMNDLEQVLSDPLTTRGLKGKVDRKLRMLGVAYSYIDFFSKYASYQTMLDEGMSAQDAAQHVRQFYQDPDSVPDFFRWASQNLPAFVADYPVYFADSLRIRVNDVRHAGEQLQKGNAIPMVGTLLSTYLNVQAARAGMWGANKIWDAIKDFLDKEDEPEEKRPVSRERLKDPERLKGLRSLLPKYYEYSPLIAWDEKMPDGSTRLRFIVAGNQSAFPVEDLLWGAYQTSAGEGMDKFITDFLKGFHRNRIQPGMLVDATYRLVTGDEIPFFGTGYKSRGPSDLNSPETDADFTETIIRRLAQFGVDVFGGQIGGQALRVYETWERERHGQDVPSSGLYIRAADTEEAAKNALVHLVRTYTYDKQEAERRLKLSLGEWKGGIAEARSKITAEFKEIRNFGEARPSVIEKANKRQAHLFAVMDNMAKMVVQVQQTFPDYFTEEELMAIIGDATGLNAEQQEAIVTDTVDSLAPFEPDIQGTRLQRLREGRVGQRGRQRRQRVQL